MSAKATFWAWHQNIKPATAKLVLLCLADCHNGDSGQCNPSIIYLSRMTGLNKKTVISGITKLEGLGVVEPSKKSGFSTQYHLLTGTENGSTENGTGTENGSTVFTRNRYRKRVGGSTENGTRTYKEPKKNLKRKTVVPEDFEITDPMREWATKNVPGFDIDRELESWMDFWRGEGEKKLDWIATWRNGMKSRAARYAKSGAQGTGRSAEANYL